MSNKLYNTSVLIVRNTLSLSLGASGGSQIQTPDLGIIRRELYHYASPMVNMNKVLLAVC
jgi:hypothetical protein